MSDFRKYLEKQLNNEEFKKEWDNSECEYYLARILATAIPVRLPRLLRMTATAIMLSATARSRLARQVPRISLSTVKFSPKVQFQT